MPANLIARFEQYNAQNPHVYDLFVMLARQWRAHNPDRKIGVKALIERVRWELGITTEGDEQYEINNSFEPGYARLIMIEEEDLWDAFELRPSQFDDWALALIAEKEAE